MKVILDANILISYLLTSETKSKITAIVESVFEGKFQVVLPHELIAEIQRKVTEKKYLAERISQSDLDEFITTLHAIAIISPRITEVNPHVVRDNKDDYLIAYAIVSEADYLVSGDEDLIILKQTGKLKILTPSEFYQILYD